MSNYADLRFVQRYCYKIPYASLDEAERVARRMRKRGRHKVGHPEAYWHPACNSYHVGHFTGGSIEKSKKNAK